MTTEELLKKVIDWDKVKKLIKDENAQSLIAWARENANPPPDFQYEDEQRSVNLKKLIEKLNE